MISREPLSGNGLTEEFPHSRGRDLPYRETVVRQEPGGKQAWPQRFGTRRVQLHERVDRPLHLVVVDADSQFVLQLFDS
jgi:hypothetical protein